MTRSAALALLATRATIGAALTATGTEPCYMAACCQCAARYGLPFSQWADIPTPA